MRLLQFKLNPDFEKRVGQLLKNCLARGCVMRPMEGLRHPLLQAKYWKQSRSDEEIVQKVEELYAHKCLYLAEVIETAQYEAGPVVTHALPGLSWHQWGEAIDCYWIVNNKASLSLQEKVNGLNGYEVYAEEALKLGMEPGLFWRKFKDGPHVQLRSREPVDLYTMPEIDKIMQRLFS